MVDQKICPGFSRRCYVLKLNDSMCYHCPLLKWVCIIFKLEIFDRYFWENIFLRLHRYAFPVLCLLFTDRLWCGHSMKFQVCFACDLCVFIFQGRNMLNISFETVVSDVTWVVTIQSLVTLALPVSDTDLLNQGSLRLSKKMLNILN